METLLIPGQSFASVTAVAAWANDLVGRYVPDNDYWIVETVLSFQVFQHDEIYDALLLARVRAGRADVVPQDYADWRRYAEMQT